MAGPPEGNTNSNINNRLWANTIRRAVLQADATKLRAIAEKLIDLASEGDMQAIKELGDRLDGKASQSVEQKTEHSGTVEHHHVRVPDMSIDEWMAAHGLGTTGRPAE